MDFTFHYADGTFATLNLPYPSLAALQAFLTMQGATWIGDGATIVNLAIVTSITTTDTDSDPAVEAADADQEV